MNEGLSGILLIDKPPGITSQQALTKLKKACRLSKVGHAGTLDPFATGLLVVLVGKATRLQEFLLQDHKFYEGVILVGQRTDTDDVTGKLLPSIGDSPSDSELSLRCSELERKFSGVLQQVPPSYSAVHIAGKRAYQLARRGTQMEGKLDFREVTVHEIRLLPLASHRLHYQLHCSKGTYVRSIARDIGEYLGCGACVETLRRTQSGKLSLSQALSLEALVSEPSLLSEVLLPAEVALAQCSKWTFSEHEVSLLRQGRQEPLDKLPLSGCSDIAGLFSETGMLIGVAQELAEAGWKLRLNY